MLMQVHINSPHLQKFHVYTLSHFSVPVVFHTNHDFPQVNQADFLTRLLLFPRETGTTSIFKQFLPIQIQSHPAKMFPDENEY